MLTIRGFSLFSEEKSCEAVILNMGCFGTACIELAKLPLSLVQDTLRDLYQILM